MSGIILRRKFWRKNTEEKWRRLFKNNCFWRKRSWRKITSSYPRGGYNLKSALTILAAVSKHCL